MKNNSNSKRIVQTYMKQKKKKIMERNCIIETLQLKHWITALFKYINAKK